MTSPTGDRIRDLAAILPAAADALDELPRLRATVAGLETTVAAQAARIRQLEDTGTHLVRAGDTLWSLARQYGTTVADLRAWNGLADNTIVVGTLLRVRGETPTPQPVTTVYGINGNRTALLGRTPEQRDYYPPGKFPATFDPATLGGVHEALAASFKLMPQEVVAGRHDALITSWLKSAAAKLPKLVAERRHLITCWHEPAREIKDGLYTAAQHGQANAHLARLILNAGLAGTFGVAINYTVSTSSSSFDPAWVPPASIFPTGILVVLTGDCYGNPRRHGNLTGYDTPYPDPGEDLRILWNVAVARGYKAWGVWEFNTPHRTHDDAEHSKRRAWLDEFVRTATTAYPPELGPAYDLLMWEGDGVNWDQRFGAPEVVEWARRFVNRSPRILA